MYQAEVTPCLFLTVTVLRGRNISKGYLKDLVDTPDPYVKIYIKKAPNARRQTRYINNDKNPEWNETFTFLLPNDLNGITAEFTLMDSNYTSDENMDSYKFELSELSIGETITKTFDFVETSQVDVKFQTELRCESDLRLEKTLCDKENDFRKARKQKVFQSIRELLQKYEKEIGPHSVDEAPVIGVLGSGGGYRAMVGYAGVMKALHDSGILDCSMYVNGLSGSSWYQAALYANETFPKYGPQEANNDIRSKIKANPYWSLFKHFPGYRSAVISKRASGQPVSYADLFGIIIGSILLGQENMDSTKLSKFDEKIKDGDAPMPILTAVHVRPKEAAKVFHDWVEFTPYEIGIAKYGSFMNTKQFGTKFFRGCMAKPFDESPLHFLMGIWGSAFSILFKEIFESKAKEGWKWKTLWKSLKPILRGDETDQLSDENVAYLSDAAATVITEPADFYSHMEHSMKMLREVPLAAINDDFDDDTDEEDDTVKRNQTNLKVNPTPTKTTLQLENQEPRLESDIFTPPDEEAPEQERPVHQLDPNLEVPEQIVAYSITNPLIGKGGSADESDEEEENEKNDEKSTSVGGIFGWLLEKMFGENNLQTRGQRTAKIFNYMRDVELNAHSDLYEQYAGSISMSSVDNAFQKINEPLEVRKKKFSLADAGIAFNSPYPPMLRAERGVDIILSFDFSARKEDDMDPLEELYLAEKWAKMSGMPFPKISEDTYKKEGLKECYVFRDEENEKAPIVIHFVLCNINFRKYSAPGVPRKPEDDWAEFDIFLEKGKSPYNTFNFQYTNEQFDKLSQLMEFNTLMHIDTIVEQIIYFMNRQQRL